MCACNGTGVIQNDIGLGMYQIASCICSNVKGMNDEEWKRRRQDFAAQLDYVEQMLKEGKRDDGGTCEGKPYQSGTGTRSHERKAS